MDVGLALPQFDFSVPGRSPLPWASVVEWAGAAERHGLASVWLADHVSWDIRKYGGPPGSTSVLDPLAALAGLARTTTSVRLGTLVLCAPLRAPAVTAKALATLDVVSHGRLTVGVGAGWYEPDFHAAGVPFEGPGARLRRLAEAVEAYKATFEGPYLPRPVQRPRPPIVVGGRGDRLLDVVARHADGWNTVWRHTPASYRERAAVLDRACERIGRDPATVERSLGLYTLVGEDEADVRRRYEHLQAVTPPGVVDRTPLDEYRRDALVGTVEQVAAQLGAWRDAGVGHLIACLGALPFAVTAVDDVALLAAAAKGA